MQSLAQATADATDQLAAFQAERQERLEELGLLRAQVAQLQALGASREREAAAAAAKAQGECEGQGGKGLAKMSLPRFWPVRLKCLRVPT